MYYGGNNSNFILNKIAPPNPVNLGPRANIKLPTAPFAPLPKMELQRCLYANRYDCESGSSSGSLQEKDKIEEFIDVLNENGIKVEKLETKDGYFIINKSLADIFKEAGVNFNLFDYKDYDDWYITGLTQQNGSTIYSMIKVREPMDKKERTGTAVVFNSMDIKPFKKIISDSINNNTPNKSTIYQVNQGVEQIVHANKYSTLYNRDLLNYFNNPKSEGSYLIADFIIEKIAHDKEFKNGVYKLPFSYEEFDNYGGKSTLKLLAEVGIYDKDANTIKINDPNNLTYNEKIALLVISTGDRDKYAFAAENQFHALYYRNLPGKESHAIKSDAGVGESKGLPYEMLFKSPSGFLYQQQIKAHGGLK